MGHGSVEVEHRDDPVTGAVIGAAITVHRALGPGLLESAYQACLCHELNKRGHHIQREAPLPVPYDGLELDCGYRLDLIVDRQVIVEVKSVEGVKDIHLAQLITYLRLSGIERGLLINFNEPVLRKGLYRRVLSARRLSPALSVTSIPGACTPAPSDQAQTPSPVVHLPSPFPSSPPPPSCALSAPLR